MSTSRTSLPHPKICSSLDEFKKMLASRARWEYIPADETYRFHSDRWPQPTFIRVTKTNLEALDDNLLAAMDYYGTQSEAPSRLIATINIWFDVERLIYTDDDEYGDQGYDIEKVTRVTGVSDSGVAAEVYACRLFQLKPNLWVARDNFGPYRIEIKHQWIDAHFPAGMTRLVAGVALGLSELEIAGLLYQPAASIVLELPQLEHGTLP